MAPELCLPDGYLALFTQLGNELCHLLPPLLQPPGRSAKEKEGGLEAEHMQLGSHHAAAFSSLQ